ncbi:glycoside hydrolase family 9 protein [soil metagenome]
MITLPAMSIIKQILFSLITFLFLHHANAQTSQRIMINQLGYYTQASKIAVITGETKTEDFFITTTDASKSIVFQGKLSAQKQSQNSSTRTRIADFSNFKKAGAYLVAVPNVGYSYAFTIADNVQQPVAKAALKGFYFQRISMPLEEQYAGKWARPEGHPDTVVLIHPSAATSNKPARTKIVSPGGWYDAGDYNKYIVNSGITMGTLLSAYEDFSNYFDTLTTNIPESSDKTPDILNEVIYNLRWMLTMQDADDGGVFNKCTNAAFDGMVMPGVTKLPRYVVQKGTAATLDFAAVTAQASRILRKFDQQLPGLSDSCLMASMYAWQWALKNSVMEYDQNGMNKQFEPKITTGGYGDKYFEDEWFWAACELYTTTKDEQFYKVIAERINDVMSLPSWSNVQMPGTYSLLRNLKFVEHHLADIDKLKKQLIDFADAYLQHVNENAFQTVMGQNKKDFIWGSNSVAANQSIVLINAYLITKDKKYIDQALSNLDYIMGRNATGYCFVTGLGTKSSMHPHHRPSIADNIEEPIPGLLAGGPNPGMQDKCHYDFTEPETAYSDIDCSYASNEIAINWNAPLVYLANAIEALQYEVGYSKKK